ncbi:MAG: type II toxin-antitoxin system Phd/YefM family antitoxin [Acidobacteriota bacterium]
MKPPRLSRDVVPLARFKSRASQYFRQMHEDQRPLVVTQNGQPAAVLVTPAEYDRLREEMVFLKAVHEGLDDSDQGRLVSDEDLALELDATFPA